MSNALDLIHVTKRYRHVQALRDCTASVPAGSIAALVGPNGAGKTTLLQIIAGLQAPTTGIVTVYGVSPILRTKDALVHTGFVAQDHPLYGGFSIAETLLLGRKLNSRWDDGFARARIEELGLPFNQRIGQLSGGQQTQVALVMALAKRPRLLLLDEPLASLDPLARRNFLRLTLEAALENNMTVILSSHIISDLERACDHLLILTGGVIQLSGNLNEILQAHKRLTGKGQHIEALADRHYIVHQEQTSSQSNLIVRLNGPLFDTSWETHSLSLEDIVLAYLGQTTVEPFLGSASEA